MCGILGIYFFKENTSISKDNFIAGLKTLQQRGPDNTGYCFEDNVWLGHTRLSVIDTSKKANQPMYDDTSNFLIVFNGEIYNYLTIRNYLLKKNIKFITNSDTEVLLKLYINEQKNILNKIIGDFAFAIYDKIEKKIIIVRDRYGVKPLYYYSTPDYFIFSSEIKAILKTIKDKKFKIDLEALYYYFQFHYIPAPFSIYKEIKKLLPYHYIEIKNNEVKINSYQPPNIQLFDEKEDDILKKFEELVHISVREHLISDVPIGCFLSGGLDSSIIAAIANQYTKLATFNVSFKGHKMYDETSDALTVSKHLGTNHNVIRINENDLLHSFFDFLNYIDEPYADSSVIALISLVKNTKNHLKVALTGDGGDELFAGYNKHKAHKYLLTHKKILKFLNIFSPIFNLMPSGRETFLTNKIRQLNKLIYASKLNHYQSYLYLASFNYEPQQLMNNVLPYDYSKYIKHTPNNLNNILLNDIDIVLSNDMLVKSDIASAMNGFEIRSPFIDYRIVEYTKSLPTNFKLNKKSKWILHQTFGNLLPNRILNKRKHGFEVPLKYWLTKPLKQFVHEQLDDNYIKSLKILNVNYINNIKNKIIYINSNDFPFIINNLLIFLYWCKKNNISSNEFEI